MTDAEQSRRVAALTEELEALKRSLPAHSLKPAMLIRIEELEEQIEALGMETQNVKCVAPAHFTFLE
jgi:hypothetical protein